MKLREYPNEHGTRTSEHVCEACGEHFAVTPAIEGGRWCLGPDCPSYDPELDAERVFDPNWAPADAPKVH